MCLPCLSDQRGAQPIGRAGVAALISIGRQRAGCCGADLRRERSTCRRPSPISMASRWPIRVSAVFATGYQRRHRLRSGDWQTLLLPMDQPGLQSLGCYQSGGAGGRRAADLWQCPVASGFARLHHAPTPMTAIRLCCLTSRRSAGSSVSFHSAVCQRPFPSVCRRIADGQSGGRMVRLRLSLSRWHARISTIIRTLACGPTRPITPIS